MIFFLILTLASYVASLVLLRVTPPEVHRARLNFLYWYVERNRYRECV